MADLTEEKLKEIKKDYMSFQTISAIARKYGVNRTTIQYHVNASWRDEREAMGSEIVSDYKHDKKVKFTAMSDTACMIIKRALEDLATRDIPPTVSEAQGAVKILAELESITNKDEERQASTREGDTEISIDDLTSKLSTDPFMRKPQTNAAKPSRHTKTN